MKDGHLYMERFGDPDAIECWTSGLIDVTGISFDRLMRKFELAYDVQIIIDRDDVPQIRYTRGKVRVSYRTCARHAVACLRLRVRLRQTDIYRYHQIAAETKTTNI